MRYLLIILLVGLMMTACKSSENTKRNKSTSRPTHMIDGHKEVYPQMIGGRQALNKELSYPEKAQKNHVEGRVILKFFVTKKGEVKDVKMVQGVSYLLDREAVRAIKEMHFLPGLIDDKPVKVRYTWPVTFRLPHQN